MKVVDNVSVARNEISQRCIEFFEGCSSVIVIKHDQTPSQKQETEDMDAIIHNILNKTGHCPLITNKTPSMRLIGFDSANTCAKVAKYINRVLADEISCEIIGLSIAYS